MPFYIRTSDGQLLLVETHVGEGLARVEVVPVERRELPAIEPSEEQS